MIGVARLSQNFLARSAARVYVEFIRNVPLVVLLVLIYIAVVLNMLPTPNDSWTLGPIAIVNVRGASIFWFEGGNLAILAAVVIAAVVAWLLALWRRRWPTAPATRPARACSAAAVVVLVLAWLVFGLGGTAPELDGRRVSGGITMTPEYFAALRPHDLHRQSHRRDRAGLDPGRAQGQGEAANSLALSASSGCGTWCSRRPCASPSRRSATSTST